MRTLFAMLLTAIALSSCASPMPADVRPEVAQPLNQAIHLADLGKPEAQVMAKLDQAASVPNLNNDERYQIQETKTLMFAKLRFRYVSSEFRPVNGSIY